MKVVNLQKKKLISQLLFFFQCFNIHSRMGVIPAGIAADQKLISIIRTPEWE